VPHAAAHPASARPRPRSPARGERIDTFIHQTFNLPTFGETYKYAAYDGLQQLSGRRP
jgi:hypothetical protein